jgi:hypothetical protein
MGAEGKLFEASTPLGFTVLVMAEQWEKIATFKHPVMSGRERDVQRTLESPEEVRRSRKDPSVYLFYRTEKPKRWLCAVTKKLDEGGFLITAYVTDAVKIGESVWRS